MTSDELISSCKSVCAFSTADALPPSQSKLHPPGKKIREKRFDIFKSAKKHLHYRTLGPLWKCSKLLLVVERFSHYWTCLMLFITCSYSRRSGLFMVSLLNCRIYYTSLHTVFNQFYTAHSSVRHVVYLQRDTHIANTHIHIVCIWSMKVMIADTESEGCRRSIPARNSRYKLTNAAIICQYTTNALFTCKWIQASPIRLGKLL